MSSSFYKSVDAVPLSFVRIRGGALVTGLTLTAKVLNVLTGTTLLSTTTMSEVTPGVYAYNWAHSQTTFTECVAIYSTSGSSFVEYFTIDESLDKEQSLAARAT